MVFSFFKKQPEKMITRPAAVPRPAAGSKEVPAGREDAENEKARSPEAGPAADDGLQQSSLEAFSDLEFSLSQSSLDFQVNADIDPVNAPAEEAAVLFANGQDQAEKAKMMEYLQALNEKHGVTIVLITHDMDVVRRYARRALVLTDGKQVFDGTPKDLFEGSYPVENWGLRRPLASVLAAAFQVSAGNCHEFCAAVTKEAK